MLEGIYNFIHNAYSSILVYLRSNSPNSNWIAIKIFDNIFRIRLLRSYLSSKEYLLCCGVIFRHMHKFACKNWLPSHLHMKFIFRPHFFQEKVLNQFLLVFDYMFPHHLSIWSTSICIENVIHLLLKQTKRLKNWISSKNFASDIQFEFQIPSYPHLEEDFYEI